MAIVGAGPAGLMLAHLLHRAGIDSVAIDLRSRQEIEETHRAGILERDSVRLLVESGVSDRVLRDGDEHEGIELAFGGATHRIDFRDAVGASVQLYPQTDVFIDLADARARDGGDVRFGVTDVVGRRPDRPSRRHAVHRRRRHRPRGPRPGPGGGGRVAQPVPHGSSRRTQRHQFHRAYPFAWFGILCEAPPSAPELIYNHSERGFALISQRTPTLQRMYFQCDPDEDAADWSDDRIWSELQARVGANGVELQEGPITSRSGAAVPHRSCRSRCGTATWCWPATPPTRSRRPGPRGSTWRWPTYGCWPAASSGCSRGGDDAALDDYARRALQRVWKAQHFSYWMTTMLHRLPDASDFDVRRQIGELTSLVGSRAGTTYLAEGYTGWPEHRLTAPAALRFR